MTNPIDRVRAAALALPEVEERVTDGQPSFVVGDVPFVRFKLDGNNATAICVRTADESDWANIDLTGDVDWPMVDDCVARSWELTAPRRLLEAGGR